MKLSFEEFKNYMKENIAEVLPEEWKDAYIDLHTTTKNNGVVLHSLVIKRKDECVAPNIYLELPYKRYEEGTELKTIMNEIAKIVTQEREMPEKLEGIGENFKDWEYVKERIFAVAVNAERNSELLKEVPHETKEDLALVYRVMVSNDKSGLATIMIRNSHLNLWDVVVEQVKEIALENTRKILPGVIRPLHEITKEMAFREGIPEEVWQEMDQMMNSIPKNEQMYVITNNIAQQGAVGMFYIDKLEELAGEIGTDLYIIPSSVHECIALSVDMGTPEEIAEMVKQVNAQEVPEDEQLSDHVYRFDAAKRDFYIAG